MEKYFKIIRYLIAGGTATAVSLGTLFICVHYLGMWYLIAAVIAFVFGVTTSYILQKFWTFRNYSKENMHKQFSAFFVFALIMLGVNTLLMYILVDIVGIWYMLAQAISAAVTAVINYLCFNRYIFNNKNIFQKNATEQKI